jgi:Tol biopolymer transport system component
MYEGINLAASEKWVALERRDPRTMKVGIWILELSTGILSLATSHLAESSPPVLSPDGREVAFTSLRNGVFTLYRKELGGGDAEVLIESNDMPVAQQWLSDGSIVFNSGRMRDFYLLPLLGRRTPVLLYATEFRKAAPQVSSDGRWVSYQSNESGRWEVYIATFPRFQEKRQVSIGGGCQPRWRKDRKELFYLSLEGRLMSVAVNSAARLETTTPKPMFQTSLRGSEEKKYWVTGDGNRFIVVEPLEDSTKPFTVVLNWTTGLKH